MVNSMAAAERTWRVRNTTLFVGDAFAGSNAERIITAEWFTEIGVYLSAKFATT